LYGVKDSVAGKPEVCSGREVGFRDQDYIDIMHIEKRLEFQAIDVAACLQACCYINQ
jgi:hypothetical protein